ncbi:hypothetical protein WJ96_06245 [Burkholderia ubonensis]|uniref:Uncharacterized protein n=1 Tax=Burkholderia ubonensis TaxID=101571 RepID=A0AAW3MTE0_9BURK|nr:hypothetical protein [Burkholderia ubonensis]KVP75358.1 hypothetical protein WJ93_08050 [Burkholderia ubonensis]KVP98169.1 hypothetical protein WJ96_06245 [Burkholderia ubonensis]KVZ92867.1 hypothetical protein WL25_17910 [Burkholderia ubonensis]
MNPLYLFSTLMLIAAVAMLRLSDRGLVRVLGIASILLGVPAMAFMSESLNWRQELSGAPTTIGYSLVAIAGVGAIFMMAAGLCAVLRLVIAVGRARAAQEESCSPEQQRR